MKATMTALLAGILALSGAAYAQHEHGAHAGGKAGTGPAPAGEGKTATFRGEVLDMACYMAHEGRGPKHVSCAKACLLGGAPAGLLSEDGSVLLLVEDHTKKGPYKALLELAGRQVSVRGKRFTRGGLAAVVVESAEAR